MKHPTRWVALYATLVFLFIVGMFFVDYLIYMRTHVDANIWTWLWQVARR